MPVIPGQSFTIQTSGAQTATGASAAVDVSAFKELDLFLTVSAASGTAPNMVVTMQSSPDGGTSWDNIPSGAFSAVTAAGNTELALTSGFGNTIRASWVITGTTPSFTFSITGVGK